MNNNRYPFWMYGDGWYVAKKGNMRFSYVLWARCKFWHVSTKIVDKCYILWYRIKSWSNHDG